MLALCPETPKIPSTPLDKSPRLEYNKASLGATWLSSPFVSCEIKSNVKSKNTGVKCLQDGELLVGRKFCAETDAVLKTAVRILHPASYGTQSRVRYACTAFFLALCSRGGGVFCCQKKSKMGKQVPPETPKPPVVFGCSAT